MQTVRDFVSDGDRYGYDFTLCTVAKGWAQLDTRQDASYFGNWINPTARRVLSYCEGDTTLVTYDDDAEFAQGLLETLQWYEEHDGKRPGIDPRADHDAPLALAFRALGFAEWLH